MKQIRMVRSSLFLLAFLASVAGWAQGAGIIGDSEPLVGTTITVGNIDYKVTSKSPRTVTVTNKAYSGSVVIPETITYFLGNEGWSYTVTAIGANAFQNCTSLTAVTIPATVKEIGASAFSDCSALQTANLGSGVESIGQSAFSYCRALQTVYISDKVKNIESNTFYYCTSLKSVTGFTSVENIQSGAFYNCSSLTTITVPASVQEIGSGAFYRAGLKKLIIADSSSQLTLTHTGSNQGSPFYGCPIDTLYLGRDLNHVNPSSNSAPFNTSLKDVVIGDSVTNIYQFTFYYCQSLQTVTFGKNIEEIGASAFSGCKTLQSANLGDKVVSIGSNAFSNCSSVQSVHISDKVKNIGSVTFYGCTSLLSVTIPASVQEIGSGAFFRAGLKKLIIADGNSQLTLIHTSFSDGSPFYGCPIDSLYWGRDLNHVNCNYNYAPFNTSLKDVVIGNSVTAIDSYSFYNCSSLQTVSFGKNIEEIGDYAFTGCQALQSANLGDKVTSIGTHAFSYCSSMQAVHISEKVNTIPSQSFDNCTSLKSVTIPAMVQEIGSDAFYGAGLKKLIIADGGTVLSLTHTGNNYANGSPFAGCPIDTLYWGRDLNHVNRNYNYAPFNTSLKYVVIGDAVTSISERTFYNCKSLQTVTFGRNIEEIGASAFYGCQVLRSANLGDNVSFIGESAFNGCSSMQAVHISKNVKIIESSTFQNCISLQSVTGFAAVDSIQPDAFYHCESLRAITIPVTVQKIGERAFWSAGLKKLVIEDSSTPLSLIHSYETYSTNESPFYKCPIDSLYLGRDIDHISRKGDSAPFNISLKDVVIGDAVTSISERTFSSCQSLQTVMFGKNIEEIGASAFYGCSGLQKLWAYWEAPFTVSDNTFENSGSVFSNAKLYVPGGTKPAYQATSCWNKFLNILPMAFEVTATATAGGSVSVNGGEAVSNDTQRQWIDRETEVTFDVMEEEDYDLASVVVNGENVTEQLVNGRFTVASLEDDVTVVATFAMLPRYVVTTSVVTLAEGVAGIGGTATVRNDSVISGRSTTVEIVTNEGYSFKKVTVNGVDKTTDVVDGVLTLSGIVEDMAVVATFQKLKFDVTATECENGSITLSASEVEWGDNVTVTITPAAHYDIDKVYVNDEDRTASLVGNVLTLQDVRGAMTIAATFSIQTFTVTASANKGGSIGLVADGGTDEELSLTADWGSSVTVTVEADEDYELTNLYVNGEDVKSQVANGSYTIAHVEADMTIEAVFKEIVEITLADGQDYNGNRNKHYETINYTRTFKNTNWQAWYVPFNLTLTNEVMEHFAFAEFAGTYTEEDGSFYITVVRMKEGSVVKANTPYCVQAKVADSTKPQVITQTDVLLQAAAANGFYVLSARKKITFWGNYTRRAVTADDENLYAMSGGKYSKQKVGNTLASFRCFFNIEDREDNPYATTPNPSEVKLMVIGGETGIGEIGHSKVSIGNGADSVYDLSGRKVNTQQKNKGIYIINGKKVLVK